MSLKHPGTDLQRRMSIEGSVLRNPSPVRYVFGASALDSRLMDPAFEAQREAGFLMRHGVLPDGRRWKRIVDGNMERLTIDPPETAVPTCTFGTPVFWGPAATPTVAVVGMNCSSGIGAVVARSVTHWDGLFPVADHVTYGALLRVIYQQPGVAFLLKPALMTHPLGLGALVVAPDDAGTIYALWAPDYATGAPIHDSALWTQAVIFEGALGAGLPRGRVFDPNPITIGTWGDPWYGWKVQPGGLVTAGMTTVYSEGTSTGYGFTAVDADATWSGVIRAPGSNAHFFDYNADSVRDAADDFTTSAGVLPGSMIEVL
jgi:hypothetical protein